MTASTSLRANNCSNTSHPFGDVAVPSNHLGNRWQMRAILFASAIFASLTASCNSPDEFTTKPGEYYCGAIVQGPFVRSGFGPATRVRMTFSAEATQSSPGNITTDDGRFVDAPLQAISPIVHDSLSLLQFGDGRQRNLILAVQPTADDTAEPMLAFVSLLDNGNAELRLLQVSSDTNTAEDQDSNTPAPINTVFGLFPLVRQKGSCGFLPTPCASSASKPRAMKQPPLSSLNEATFSLMLFKAN